MSLHSCADDSYIGCEILPKYYMYIDSSWTHKLDLTKCYIEPACTTALSTCIAFMISGQLCCTGTLYIYVGTAHKTLCAIIISSKYSTFYQTDNYIAITSVTVWNIDIVCSEACNCSYMGSETVEVCSYTVVATVFLTYHVGQVHNKPNHAANLWINSTHFLYKMYVWGSKIFTAIYYTVFVKLIDLHLINFCIDIQNRLTAI